MITIDINESDCVQDENGAYECKVKLRFIPEAIVIPPPEPPTEPPPVEPPIIPPPVGGDVLHVDFSDTPKGKLSDGDLKEIFGVNGRVITRSEFAVVDDPANSGRSNVMSVFYPKGKAGNQSGGQWAVNIPGRDQYYFSQDIFVPAGFNWPISNKVSGLYGGNLDGATGGEETYGITGWSVRQDIQSERRSGDTAGYFNIGDGAIGAKLGGYKPQKKHVWYGERLIAGRWGRIEQQVDIAAGTYRAWVNGKLAYTRTGMQYSKNGNLDIDGVSFVFWYGGGPPGWNAREDQHWYYDNFIVSTQPISH